MNSQSNTSSPSFAPKPWPRDSDLSDLQTTIASATVDLSRYHTEIKTLRETLNRLSSERDALQRYSDDCRSFFAPVRRLPPEILAEIFVLDFTLGSYMCCDDTQHMPLEFGRGPHLMQLLQVCSTWYDTIMTTPSLWANIAVDLALPQPTSPNSQLSRCLARSGNRPLTIKLAACIGRGHMHSSLELLGLCAERWRFADLHLEEGISPLLWRLSGNLPRLERLALGGDGADGIDLFATAPSLTRVVLSDINGAPPKLPWGQLHEMTYYASRPCSFNADDIANRLAVMSHCSRHCEFNMYSLDLGHFVERRRTLPCGVGRIIGVLTLPNLRELLFRSSIPDNDPLFWPREQFPAFASRSSLGDTLTKLFLYHMVITEDELAETIPGDVDFEREEHILITDALFQRLTWRSDSASASCLVPELHTFSFASLFFFDDSAFLDFLEPRVAPARDRAFTVEAFLPGRLRTRPRYRRTRPRRRGGSAHGRLESAGAPSLGSVW
ncbi:hypothetical protein B0H14DRAFT_3869117 [Mycena olivaceomarginata]|nr:hypothetical protein B0H14DRAFT_3869117 [Mycena olivaceomarginata]